MPNWLLVLVMIELLSKCFCFGFDFVDLFDFYLGYMSIICFSILILVLWFLLIPILGLRFSLGFLILVSLVFVVLF